MPITNPEGFTTSNPHLLAAAKAGYERFARECAPVVAQDPDLGAGFVPWDTLAPHAQGVWIRIAADSIDAYDVSAEAETGLEREAGRSE